MRSIRNATLLVLFAAVAVVYPAAGQVVESRAKERGFKADSVYQFNGFDTVNLFNGNLILSLPLGPSYPVGGGLSYSFTLRYSGNLWAQRESCSRSSKREPICADRQILHRDNAGVGWRLSFGELREPELTPERYDSSGYLWAYRSPDGGDHVFFRTLHAPECGPGQSANCDPVDDNTRYTRDGSYLRLKKIDENTREVEFPDGLRHRFVKNNSLWELRLIYNRHVDTDGNRNYVQFDYSPNTWTITDSRHRTHTVEFSSAVSDVIPVVSAVRLAAVGGQTASYLLTHHTTNLPRPCDALNSAPEEAQFLDTVTLPSLETYSFHYDEPSACSSLSGTLTDATLPTGGRFQWSYKSVMFGPYSGDEAIGVQQKQVFDAAGTLIAKTGYELSTAGQTVVKSYAPANAASPTVKSVNYFQANRTIGPTFGSTFGLPFSTEPLLDFENPRDGRYLSSVTYDCSSGTCNAERAQYVKYEMDISGAPCTMDDVCWRERNQRVKSQQTLYITDSNKTADVNYDRYDGLGHYRLEVTGGTFDSSAKVRRTFTDYNAGTGDYALTASDGRAAGYTTPSASSPWILHTYTTSNVTETDGGPGPHQEAYFDPATGFLTRKRIIENQTGEAGSHDLLAVFTPSSEGYVATEEYFGGDMMSLLTGPLREMVLPQHNAYSFKLVHEFTRGTSVDTETTRYEPAPVSGLTFFVSDLTLDHNTGLALQSRDTANLVTTYTYDASGRLTSVQAPDEAKTEYEYRRASGSTPAQITARSTNDVADQNVERTFEFDALGRVVTESHLLPDGSKSKRVVVYDALGRKTKVSEDETGTPTHFTTFSNFDAFGRARTVTAPDGAVTTFTYVGERATTRRNGVATSATAQTQVAVKEEYDRVGRLIRVTENADSTTPVVTAYEYDLAGHLANVIMAEGSTTQTRSFVYDGRQLLTQETHPESGTTSYKYDARGHVVSRTTPAGELRYVYDSAERLTQVKSGTTVLKEFNFARANSTGDSALGKLAYASRLNPTPLGDITVKETFTYGGLGGRLSKKKTEISNGPTFEDAYSYTAFGQLASVDYPKCLSCAAGTLPPRIVSNEYQHGALTSVGNYATLLYAPNGMVAEVQHKNGDGTNGPKDTQTPDNGTARPKKIEFTGYCAISTLTQPQDKTVPTGAMANVTFSIDATGATYKWYVVGSATEIPGQTGSTLTVSVPQTTAYYARASFGGCSVDSRVVVVTTSGPPCGTPPAITASPLSTTIMSGQTTTLSVSATGTTLSYQWFDGQTTIAGATAASYTTPPLTTPHTYRVRVTNTCGSIDSATATVNITECPLPTIVVPPVSAQDANYGQTVTLSVSASGHPPLSYQWYQGVTGDTSHPVGTSATFTTPALTKSAVYWVRVSEVCGSVDSPPALISVCEPPMILQPTADYKGKPQGAYTGTTFAEHVVAVGTGASYKWEVLPVSPNQDGSWTITGAPLFALPDVTPDILWTITATPYQAGSYYALRVTVTGVPGGCGGTAQRIVDVVRKMSADDCPLTVESVFPPSMPVNWAGHTIELAIYVNAPNSATDTYRWFVNGVLDTAGSVSTYPIMVTTSATVTVEVERKCNIGGVEVVKFARRTVFLWNPETCPVPPLQVDQSTIRATSSNRTFTAWSPWTSVTFQWYAGDSGNTDHPLASDAGQPDRLTPPLGAGTYWVRATSECGTTADSRTLTVYDHDCSPVQILRQPRNVSTAAGVPVTLDYAASSTPEVSSQTWYELPGNVVRGTGRTFTPSPEDLQSTKRYWVEVRNSCHSAASAIVTVRVASCGSITVSQQPQSASIINGSTATLSVTAAAGGQPLTYQWYEGESGDDSGAVKGTGSSLTVTPSKTTKYWVRIKLANTCAIDSNVATVWVCVPPRFTDAIAIPGQTDPPVVSHPPILSANPSTPFWITTQATGTAVKYEWFQGDPPTVTTKLGDGPAFKIAPATTTRFWARATSDCQPPQDDRTVAEQFVISVCPTITAQPSATPAKAMKDATVTLQTTVARNDTVTWYAGQSGDMSGGPISTGATYAVPKVTPPAAYWARVTSGDCNVNSQTVTVAACDKPVNAVWSANVLTQVSPNYSQIVGVNATADPGATYTIYEGPNGDTSHVLYTGTNNALTITATKATNTYWARVQQGACYADTPLLTVEACLESITSQPQSVLLDTVTNPAATATLRVATDWDQFAGSGTQKVNKYAWYQGASGDTTRPLTDSAAAKISGSATAVLTVAPATDTTYWVRVTNCAVRDSNAATVTVCVPPAIGRHPSSKVAVANEDVALDVGASGTELTYQWYKGLSGDTTAPVAGATQSVLSVRLTQTADYWVRVRGRCGTAADSTTAKVSIPATISSHPSGGPITSGTTRTLSVTASGTQLAYQWYSGSGTTTPISGATASSYTTPPVTVDSSYWVKVNSGAAVINSNTATLTVCQPRNVTIDPYSFTSGGAVTMRITSPGPGETFEWYRGTRGTTSALIGSGTVLTVNPLDTTNYWVRTKRTGCDADGATVTVLICYPAITTQPQGSMITTGSSKTLTVAATGTQPLTYQWYIGGSGDRTRPISGATGTSYSTGALTATTTYWADVRSPNGGCSGSSTASAAATVTVCAPPAITTDITDRTVTTSGDPLTITVYASGDGLSYQWYQGTVGDTSTPVGTNSDTLALNPTTTKYYWVRVSGTCGTANSRAALVSVPPSITAQPASVTVCPGSTATFSVTATGTMLSYEWSRRTNGGATVDIVGNAATLTIPITTSGTFSCLVRSGTAGTWSAAATATVSSAPGVSILTSYQGGTGYFLTASVSSTDAPKVGYTWYAGALGDFSTPLSYQKSVYVSVNTRPSTYWVRVQYAAAPGCWTDRDYTFQ
ncbi:MAG TPA: hypothetical protein VF824_16840 [Thermoanaerobaculia bacterium]